MSSPLFALSPHTSPAFFPQPYIKHIHIHVHLRAVCVLLFAAGRYPAAQAVLTVNHVLVALRASPLSPGFI